MSELNRELDGNSTSHECNGAGCELGEESNFCPVSGKICNIIQLALSAALLANKGNKKYS